MRRTLMGLLCSLRRMAFGNSLLREKPSRRSAWNHALPFGPWHCRTFRDVSRALLLDTIKRGLCLTPWVWILHVPARCCSSHAKGPAMLYHVCRTRGCTTTSGARPRRDGSLSIGRSGLTAVCHGPPSDWDIVAILRSQTPYEQSKVSERCSSHEASNGGS